MLIKQGVMYTIILCCKQVSRSCSLVIGLVIAFYRFVALFCIFSERTTLRSLYAISRPSVVCLLSVCRLSVCDVGAPYSGG